MDYSELTAVTGIVNISTANSNIDGTGSITALITGGTEGVIVNSVIIKATGSTSVGMIRFFIKRSTTSNYELYHEQPVPSMTQSATQSTFEIQIPGEICLGNGNILGVSTEIAESFNIIAEGLNWQYPAESECCDKIKKTANNGIGRISTANTNLNGSGAIVDIHTGCSTSFNGYTIDSVSVKAHASTAAGMVRLFISPDSGSTYFLFSEIYIAPSTRNNLRTQLLTLSMPLNLSIQNDTYYIAASTENAETFSVIIDALNWSYP